MKLSEFFNPATGRLMHKKAKLLIDITLDNGESMKSGETGSLLKDYGDGYHFESNDFACKVKYNEVQIIDNKALNLTKAEGYF